MAGCGGDASQFCGVLPLLALNQDKLTSGEVTPADFVPHTTSPAEVNTVAEMEVVREEPALSLSLSHAEALLQKVEVRKSSLKEELDQVNTQLVEVMSANEGLKAEIKKAQGRLEEVNPGHLQHIQTQRLRADDLIKEIEKFRGTELKALEQEAHDLGAAQRKTSADLISETKECQALLDCLRGKERQVYGELWRLEDEATLLEGKSVCWKQFEAASVKAGEESRQRHHHTLAALEIVVQDFIEVNRKAEEVRQSLASQRLLSQLSPPSQHLPQQRSPSQHLTQPSSPS